MLTSINNAQDRALQDTLSAERSMRDRSEKVISELTKLLIELAVRYDGQRLEDTRRADPNGLAVWTVKDWKRFFDTIARKPQVKVESWQPDGGNAQKEAALETEVMRLKAEVMTLKSDLFKATHTTTAPDAVVVDLDLGDASAEPLPPPPPVITTSTQQVRGKKKQPKKKAVSPDAVAKVAARIEALGAPEANLPEGMTGSLSTILADLLVMQKSGKFPEIPPAAWRQRLDGKGRKGNDLSLAYQRYWSALWLFGRWGIVSKMEVETIIALSNGLSTRSGALGRVMADLAGVNLLEPKDSRLSTSPSSALKMFRLSQDGKALFELLFDRPAIEDELSIMYEKHEGERFPDHTLAVLIFALHARRRGWSTQLMPSIADIGSKAVPDLVVLRGAERYYTEVERGQKEKKTKWVNIAELNKGTVALCAMTEVFRQQLVRDCKLSKIKSGVATDLKTLVSVNYSAIGIETPLWEEKW